MKRLSRAVTSNGERLSTGCDTVRRRIDYKVTSYCVIDTIGSRTVSDFRSPCDTVRLFFVGVTLRTIRSSLSHCSLYPKHSSAVSPRQSIALEHVITMVQYIWVQLVYQLSPLIQNTPLDLLPTNQKRWNKSSERYNTFGSN